MLSPEWTGPTRCRNPFGQDVIKCAVRFVSAANGSTLVNRVMAFMVQDFE